MARTARQSQQLKKAFLAAFRDTGIVRAAADDVGIHRSTVYWWLEHDEAFSLEYRQAEEESTQLLERVALRRAVEGVPKLNASGKTYIDYSDTLLIFLLKARRPNTYRDRVQLQHADANGEKFPLEVVRKALGIAVAAGGDAGDADDRDDDD